MLSDIKDDNKFFTISNIYAPNEDNPVFFGNIFGHICYFRREELILGGDFNMVSDIKKDKKGGIPKTYQNALKVINQKCKELGLIDI